MHHGGCLDIARIMEIHGVSVHRKSPKNADRKFETSNKKKNLNGDGSKPWYLLFTPK
jgi:hypothetical protein